MKVFEKTKSLVEEWNFIKSCVGSPYASEEEIINNLNSVVSFHPFAENELVNELMGVCPDIAQLQVYFNAWVNIIIQNLDTSLLDVPPEWGYREIIDEIGRASILYLNVDEHKRKLYYNATTRCNGLPIEIGRAIKDLANTYNLSLPTLPEQFLSAWDIIEAAQSANNDNVGDNATHDEESRFRAIYEDYIKNMDSFLNEIHTMKGRELAQCHKKYFSRSPITLKEFVNDVLGITPERKGEKGWNYEAIRKY